MLDGENIVKFNTKATPECYPFPNTTALFLFVFTVKWQLSRPCLADLTSMLRVCNTDVGNIVEKGGRSFSMRMGVPTNL